MNLSFKAGLILFVGLIVGCSDEVKPERSDCIVKINLLWTVEGVQRSQSINKIGKILRPIFRPKAVTTFRHSGSELYLQFLKSCESRYDIARNIEELINSSKIFGLKEASVFNGSVLPGINTIDVDGEYWRTDGEKK